MSNVSSVTNYFPTVNEGFTTTLGSTITSGASTVPLTGVSGLTNGTVFVGIIEPGLSAQQVFTGIVNTATNSITNVIWTRGTNVSHNGGVTIVDYTTGTGFNMISTGILKQHNQDGTHNAAAAASIAPLLPNNTVPGASLVSNSVTPTQMLGVDLFGVSNTVTGVIPPAAGTGQFYMQAGSLGPILNASGNATVTFPTAFPNGILTIVAVDGDFTVGGTWVSLSGYSTTGFTYKSSLSNNAQRINWIAIGW